jgi:hypothetical protein
MKTVDDIVFIMNIMLYAKEFNSNEFQDLLNEIREKYHPKIGMLDFVFYDVTKSKWWRNRKIDAVRNSDFDKAASYLNQEKLAEEFMQFKKRFKIKKSIFTFEKNYLVYLYVGNARNDKKIKEFFSK